MNDYMTVFLLSLLIVVVALLVWFSTSEYYERRQLAYKQEVKRLNDVNRQLEDDLHKLDIQLKSLDAVFGQYTEVLEGTRNGLEVTL
jgi:hypothetical protein